MRRNQSGAVKNIGDYLTKVTLWRGLRLHIFWRGDKETVCHDHPNDFWTFPLVPYIEQYIAVDGLPAYRVVRAFRLHRRKAEFAHRVVASFEGFGRGDGCIWPIRGTRPIVTLLWWCKPRRAWGFHTDKGWVPWEQFTDEPVVATPAPGEAILQVYVDQMKLVDTLRSDEGNSVTILCDNPEGPPNNAVEVQGAWTEWEDRRFDGETLLEALTKAAEAYRSHQSEDLRVPGGYRGPTSVPTLPPVGGSSIMPPPKRRWRFWR